MAEASAFQRFSKWFWSEHIWLPRNYTWEDFANTEKIKYAQFHDLYYALLVAVVLFVVRIVLEKFVFTPIGIYLGLKPTKLKRAPDNGILEKAFRTNGRIGYKQVQGLAKQLDWPERKVERWLRQRNQQEKPTTLAKFTESAWRCAFYSFAFGYGLYTLSDKPWLWDTMHCWYDYPNHSVTDGIWWYYMIELGFYWSLIFSQFLDVKRKDFLQMFVHHVVTILLLCLSWAANLFRVGTLVLVVHDFADCPLEAAKMAKYLRWRRIANATFTLFFIVWLVSRLGLYPYRVIYSTSVMAITVVEISPAYYIFNALLIALQVLHVLWTWMIVRIAKHAFANKEIKDLRSDDSSDSDASVGRNEEAKPAKTARKS